MCPQLTPDMASAAGLGLTNIWGVGSLALSWSPWENELGKESTISVVGGVQLSEGVSVAFVVSKLKTLDFRSPIQ